MKKVLLVCLLALCSLIASRSSAQVSAVSIIGVGTGGAGSTIPVTLRVTDSGNFSSVHYDVFFSTTNTITTSAYSVFLHGVMVCLNTDTGFTFNDQGTATNTKVIKVTVPSVTYSGFIMVAAVQAPPTVITCGSVFAVTSFTIGATDTPTNTPTNTATVTPTNTPTNSATATPTKTPTNTRTATNTPTNSPTRTPTNTPTVTITSTPSSGCVNGSGTTPVTVSVGFSSGDAILASFEAPCTACFSPCYVTQLGVTAFSINIQATGVTGVWNACWSIRHAGAQYRLRAQGTYYVLFKVNGLCEKAVKVYTNKDNIVENYVNEGV